ncbi:MAG TPA: PIG-L family deacetylase [Salinarimonas sp.]|nr:PIG-L family deacetylase [Salinarimonas sp.]
MPTALALSPHLDDAAFSCGGTLAMLADAGWRVVIATTFTSSVPEPTGFALACQLDKGLGPEVDYMALRRGEDAGAAAILGAEPEWLPLPEAPHRGYGSAEALFGPTLASDTVEAPLGAALAALVERVAPELILAPQAVGGHVDHVVLVRALRRLAPAAPVLWWRDYPYCVRAVAPREPFAAAFEALEEIAVPLDPGALARRCEAALAYGSQIGFQFGGPDRVSDSIRRDGSPERFRTRHAAQVAALLDPVVGGTGADRLPPRPSGA